MGSKRISSKEEIENFLKIFKSCWDKQVVSRISEENDDTLAVLEITPEHRAEEIKNLQVENYVKGPTPDHDGTPDKEWWEFGAYVKSYEIYIKIAVYKNKGRCMSFHFPNYEITYPYKRKGNANEKK